MDSENRIDYIEIPARDPQRAREFFAGLFQWAFEDYGPDPNGNEFAIWSDKHDEASG